MPVLAPGPRTLLAASQWRALEQEHAERADALTRDHRARAARGQRHPVEDFLYTYYSYKPALLRRWHPGAGVALADGAAHRGAWRWYAADERTGDAWVDADAYRHDKAPLIRAVAGILRATAGRSGAFGCFGLHEWAMVYRSPEHRHEVPLRLGQTATDAVVDAHELRCTHVDAFRFFTPEAASRNRTALRREDQPAMEQPACLHAGMDLYKWAVKLGPLVPGAVLLDAFALARDIRVLDMQASPYDLSVWGYEPVMIETAEGKAEYVRRQRAFADRSAPIRAALLAAATA